MLFLAFVLLMSQKAHLIFDINNKEAVLVGNFCSLILLPLLLHKAFVPGRLLVEPASIDQDNLRISTSLKTLECAACFSSSDLVSNLKFIQRTDE